jgi:hypothetical protein
MKILTPIIRVQMDDPSKEKSHTDGLEVKVRASEAVKKKIV